MGSASDISRLICLFTDFFVRHLLLLYRVLLDTLRTPLIALIQSVIGWSGYATSCRYNYWIVGELYSLLSYMVLLDGL
jgi:hypothetical protein